ncbi:baseplate hub protein [Acidaminococcus massiliensis]|uniref:baseplate hub protein n=1 Tax=Acidaminococcus massiliensis TaxID=1852375 RepID=UPI00248E1082|nr:hypothetical protein [Acidaminococcus massiliensis]
MNGKLWLRKWKILIADKNDNEALNVSELHCTFEVHKSRDKNGFYATCKIYNLTAATEKQLIDEGDRLIIEAGYSTTVQENANVDSSGNVLTDEQASAAKASGQTVTSQTVDVELQYGKIFDGQIIWSSRSKESNVDYVLTLTAIDGDSPLHLNFIKKTVNKGLNQRQALQTVCDSAEKKIPTNMGTITDGLSLQALPRGKVFFGDPTDYIADICRGNAADYYVEDGNLHVTRLQDISNDEALVVTPDTGLIGMPQQTQFGVAFKLLLNPAIHLGTLVKLKNSEVNEAQVSPGQQQAPLDDEWIYRVTALTHSGDTRGTTWYTSCQGISRYGKGTLPAMLANSKNNGMGV